MSSVHAVLPGGVDDPAHPSGGNVYDRHVCRELRSLGWTVHEHAVAGSWPEADATSLAGLADLVAGLPDQAVVLLDGLVASAAPEALVPQAARLRLVVLVHMPLGDRPSTGDAEHVRARERSVLSAATTVVTTSAWSRRRLRELYPGSLPRIHVVPPGAHAAEIVTGSAGGGALLCVAAVTFGKGHDLLVEALQTISDLSWRCVCVGALDREPAFVDELRCRVADAGLSERVSFSGPRVGADLCHSYAAADLLVLASRAETYGMVVTEALARGLPVIATDVGGVAEAMGHDAGGVRPGLLSPAGDAVAYGAALRAWMNDANLRGRLRAAARARSATLAGWADTASALADALTAAS